MLKQNNKTSIISDYFMIVLLLCLSGNWGIFNEARADIIVILSTLILGGVCIQKKRMFSEKFVVITLFFVSILFIQCVSFGFWPLITMAGFFCRLFIGYAVITLVKDFPRKFVTVMFYVVIISLFFHGFAILLQLTGLDIITLFSPIDRILAPERGFHIGIHNYHAYGRISQYSRPIPWRNSSFFWEPGAFAGYLILAMIFLVIVKDKLSNRVYKRYFIVLSIALFTTLSTTGYIAYLLIPLLHYVRDQQTTKTKTTRIAFIVYIILPILIGSSFFAYNKIPFLKEKVEDRLYWVEVRKTNWHKTRMGSLILNWEYIKRRPLEGWGLHQTTRYALNPEFIDMPQGMGNGMSDFTVKFGITGMLIWLFFLFRAMMYLTEQNLPASMIGMLGIVLVLQGECFLGYPLFLGLMFLQSSLRSHNSMPSRING